MKAKIEAILAPAKAKGLDAGCEFNGTYWEVWVGSRAGARKNGESLARELMAEWEAPALPSAAPVESKPVIQTVETVREVEVIREVPVEVERIVTDPAQEALIEHLRAELAEAKARKGDMFDAEALADLIRENEPHADAQRRWQSDYNQLNNRLVDTRLPPLSDNERALLNRLQRALYAGRKGAVETI